MTSLMRGMHTTSKLVGKLHSMRAQQSGTGQGASFAQGSMDMEDDKWDWMTGVPTSIRLEKRLALFLLRLKLI